MANLTPEELNKLVRSTTKKMNSGESVSSADIKNILSIFEKFTENFDYWTKDIVDDFIKESRKVLGLDKNVDLLDQLEKDSKEGKVSDKKQAEETMSKFSKDMTLKIANIFKNFSIDIYENAFKPMAKNIIENFSKITTHIGSGFKNIKVFFTDSIFKFGSIFRNLLVGDITGVISDAFSILKTTLVGILSLSINILKSIFSSVSFMVTTLYNLAKFAFKFIYKSLIFIAKTAFMISSFMIQFVFKVAYKILTTVSTIATNVIGYVASAVLTPLLFVAGSVALLIFSVYLLFNGLKLFFAGGNSPFGTITTVFNSIITSITSFFTDNAFFKPFTNFLNEWWMDIWEGESVKLAIPLVGNIDTGVRTGGLNLVFGGIVSDILETLSTWWYGKNGDKFGTGGVSKDLKEWWQGADGNGGLIGTIKNSIFGPGSAGLTFMEILKQTFNPIFSSILRFVGSAVKIIAKIARYLPGINAAVSMSELAQLEGFGDNFQGMADKLDLNSAGIQLKKERNILLDKKKGANGIDVASITAQIDQNKKQSDFITSGEKNNLITMALDRFKSIYIANKMDLYEDYFGKNKSFLNLGFVNKSEVDLKNELEREMPNILKQMSDKLGYVGQYKPNIDLETIETNISALKNLGIMGYRSFFGDKKFLDSLDLLNNKEFSDDYLKNYLKGMGFYNYSGDKARLFATGGIVTGPTRAIIGEGEYPEMVIPLNDSGVKFIHEAVEGINQPYIGDNSSSTKFENKIDTVISMLKDMPNRSSAPVIVPSGSTTDVAEMVSMGIFEYNK